MSTRLIIEGNAVYEIDEDCQACSQKTDGKRYSASNEEQERIAKDKGRESGGRMQKFTR